MRRLIALLGLIGLLATPAFADITVRYKVKDQAKAITLSVADNGNARFDSGDGAVLIVREGERYFVASDGQGPIVGRVEDGITIMAEFVAMLMQVMEQAARQAAANPQPGAAPSPSGFAELRGFMLAPYSVQETGAETVGGRTGTRYAITRAPPGPQGPPLEVVIATDADLAPVGSELRALLGLAARPAALLLGQSPDILGKLDEVLARGTPIRIGDQFRLDSVSEEPVAAASFELPGPPLTLEQLRARASPVTMMGANAPDSGPGPDDE